MFRICDPSNVQTLPKLIAVVATTIGHCAACVVITIPTPIGPNFRVEVQDHGSPVKDLGLRLSGSNLVIAKTDNNGIATFRNVRTGSYYLSPDHDAGFTPIKALEVTPTEPANLTLHLQWPTQAPIVVRNLKGTIRPSSYLPWERQPEYSLDLMEGFSGRLLKSTQINDQGEFSFEGVNPGLYFLNLRAPFLSPPAGNLIAVAVNKDGTTDHLDVDFGETSCGFSYTDRNQCVQPDLHITRLSGALTDPAGASIAGGTILLYDQGGHELERLMSDFTGHFTSPKSFAGKYELVVKAPGFTSLHRPVQLGPPDNAAQLSISVQLGVGGTCSRATAQ